MVLFGAWKNLAFKGLALPVSAWESLAKFTLGPQLFALLKKFWQRRCSSLCGVAITCGCLIVQEAQKFLMFIPSPGEGRGFGGGGKK
jgi:hypothetical protein